jgi:hypothetical protein
MVDVELAKEGDDAAIQSANDVVANTDWKSLACCKWVGCVDDALDELVYAGHNNLSVGPRQSLWDMLKDSMGLIRVARAQDYKYQGADGAKAKEKKLGNKLVFDHVGVNVGLLDIKVSATKCDWAALEAGVDDLLQNLACSHYSDVSKAMECREDVHRSKAICHIDQLLRELKVVHQFEYGSACVPGAKIGCKIQADLDTNESHILLMACSQISMGVRWLDCQQWWCC